MIRYIITFLILNTSLLAYGQAVLENENIKVKVAESGLLSVIDQVRGVSWNSKYPGWVEVFETSVKEKISLGKSERSIRTARNRITIIFNGLFGNTLTDPDFSMEVLLKLSDNHLDIEISNLSSKFKLQSIEYPAHLLSVKSGDEDGYIVAPNLQGILIPSRYDAGFMRYGQNIWDEIADKEHWWTLESGNLNMPWFGANKDNSSLMAVVLTSSDCQLHLIGNKLVKNDGMATIDRKGHTKGERISSLSPIWLATMQSFGYARKMRLEFVENGYVGMAKKYKEYAKQSGRYVTLQEKILKNAEYEKIIGAPDIKIYCYTNRLNEPSLKSWSEPVLNGYSRVNTSFDQVSEFSKELKSEGVNKCLILLAGWNRMGYDREHVDMWPPAEKAGGISGLRKAAETVKAQGYLFALHDNYDDFYPDAPTYDEKYILRKADGSLEEGGIWDGGLCHIICPVQREGLLDRNMALIQNDIPLNAYYFDVITNTSHYECYDQRHPVSRRDDLRHRLKLLKNITDRGLVIGGERGTDWAMPEVAFCEGLSGGGIGFHRGLNYRTGITIPLFYLVYHECVVGYWQHGTPSGREDHVNHMLMDLLNAQPSSWSIEYDQFEDMKPLIVDAYKLLSPLHENTAHSAMINHKILSDDYMVQKSEFENGTEVWVNYGLTTYKADQFEIPPKGFRILVYGKKEKSGSFVRTYSQD